MRLSVRAKGMVSRTCSRPQIQATQRSMPMPKPEWGTLPYLRRSRYHWKASMGRLWLDAGLEEVVVVYALAAADDFAVAFGGEDVYAESLGGVLGSGCM